jgi:Avidin family
MLEAMYQSAGMNPIDGKWISDLGSTMDIRVEGDQVVGTYTTHIGSTQGTYPLVGRTDVGDDEGHSKGTLGSIGWVVGWKNAQGNDHGVTTWTGQVQVSGGEVQMVTTWIYVQETAPDANWNSTLIGFNLFTRLTAEKG